MLPRRSRRTRASRKFPLEYLNARDASEFIAPLLSEVGKVSFAGDVDKGFQPSANDGGSDSWAFQGMLVVSDYADNLAGIEKLLGEIDTPPAQVVVESTVVSSKVQQNDGFGVDGVTLAAGAAQLSVESRMIMYSPTHGRWWLG